MNNIEWDELGNYEIEIKLKELEFSYENAKKEITLKYIELEKLNKEYLAGNLVLDKRLYPGKTK